MESRKVGAMEKTTPQLSSSSSSSSEVKVKVEPQMERNTVFNSQVGQPGVTHIWNNAQMLFSGPLPGRPQYNFCQHNDLDQKRELMQQQIRQFQQFQQRQVGVTHIWNDAQLPLTGPVPGRPQNKIYQHEDLPKALTHQMISQQQLLCSRPHLNSHASKQPGAAAPIASNETHSDDGVISRKRSQERLSQVGELAAGSRTNRMRYTHSAEAQMQPGMQQQRFSQILEEFNRKFEEGMIKMEERMTKFEERMAIVPQLVDRISELEKNLENLASIRSKDTGNTTTLVEGKLTNLTISDIKPEEGYTSEQEGYTCGEDFVHLSEE